MWRKPTEAKPSSQASNAPAPIQSPIEYEVAPQVAPGPPAVSTAPISSAPISTAPISMSPVVATVAAPSRVDSSTIVSGLKINGEVTGTSDLFIDGEAHG